MKFLSAIFLSLMFAAGAHAQSTTVYTWVDADGVRHYSQLPPSSGKYQERSVRSGTSGRTDVPASSEGESLSCRNARINAQNLADPATRLMIDRDGDGTREVMNDAERKQALDLAERQVKAFCTVAGEGEA